MLMGTNIMVVWVYGVPSNPPADEPSTQSSILLPTRCFRTSEVHCPNTSEGILFAPDNFGATRMLVGWGPKPSRPSDGSRIPGLALVSTTTCSSETGVEAMNGTPVAKRGRQAIVWSVLVPYGSTHGSTPSTPISHEGHGECDGQR